MTTILIIIHSLRKYKVILDEFDIIDKKKNLRTYYYNIMRYVSHINKRVSGSFCHLIF